MELSLQTFFDLGLSYGLGDEVFRTPNSETASDIPNPLGKGLICQLNQECEILREWKSIAVEKVDAEDMELGFLENENLSDLDLLERVRFIKFKDELKEAIKKAPILSCRITIHAIGIAFIRLDFGGDISCKFLYGFARCFEYAAYTQKVSNLILNRSINAMEEATGGGQAGIKKLSKRSKKEADSDKEIDSDGSSKESDLLTTQGITKVVVCIDEKDNVDEIKRIMFPPTTNSGSSTEKFEEINFEFHGMLYFNWAACIIKPRSFGESGISRESIRREIGRILLCMQIAHSFFGTCQAFQQLVLRVVLDQANSYVGGGSAGDKSAIRHPEELSRLRTLSLAVVSLTDFSSLTTNEEDRSYFECFEKYARIKTIHREIEERFGNLLGILTGFQNSRQQERLDTFVLVLTASTVLSVFVDSYSFLEQKEAWQVFGHDLSVRWLSFALVIMLLLIMIWRVVFRDGRDN